MFLLITDIQLWTIPLEISYGFIDHCAATTTTASVTATSTTTATTATPTSSCTADLTDDDCYLET